MYPAQNPSRRIVLFKTRCDDTLNQAVQSSMIEPSTWHTALASNRRSKAKKYPSDQSMKVILTAYLAALMMRARYQDLATSSLFKFNAATPLWPSSTEANGPP